MNGVVMSTFTIDTDNNIQAYAEAPASSNPAEVFSTQKELFRLAADWPAARLVEVWNSFAGAAPFNELRVVKKFTNRKTALSRIWRAIQRLAPDVATQAANTAPGKRKTKKPPTVAKPRGTARPRAQRAANVARKDTKKAEVLDMMRGPNGATLAELMKLTRWQAHTVRGFVSGTLTKKLGLKIESFRAENKERTYRIK
jgi:hypothetical protein